MLGLPLSFLHMEEYVKPVYNEDEREVKREMNVSIDSIKPAGLCRRCQDFYDQHGFLSPHDSCLDCLKLIETADKRPTCRVCSMQDCHCEGYQCAYCNQNFPTTFLLQKHTFIHCADSSRPASETDEEGKELQCQECHKTFELFEPSRHNCSSKFICHICGGGLSSAYNLRIHLMKHSGDLPHKCDTCGKSFSKPSELVRHNRVHSGLRLASRPGLKSYPCEVCNKPFTRPADLRRHVLTHSGTRPFACSVCGLAFCDTSNLKKHIATHMKDGGHQLQAKTYHCSYCTKLFSRPSELKRHFATHTNSRPFSCDFCGLAFGDTSNLRKHITSHARSGLKNCVICSAIFDTFEDLEVHIATHPKTTEEQSECVRCDICGKSFSSELYLSGHRAGHTEARPYPCSQCLKTFKSLSHLKNHILTHTGDRGHVCSTCGKAFLTKSSLRRHETIHSRSLPLVPQQYYNNGSENLILSVAEKIVDDDQRVDQDIPCSQ
ncbi:zinc finger protein OZF-like [Cimex lectularius]|uniref:C2H2-type domain-containing protein n=1 Tax=Cimex lectularius TaxID=79782 RepID=A0A8I6RHQ3_CIMLE|nr:zinc finger protein OZF-like [Cimex lectularius]